MIPTNDEIEFTVFRVAEAIRFSAAGRRVCFSRLKYSGAPAARVEEEDDRGVGVWGGRCAKSTAAER